MIEDGKPAHWPKMLSAPTYPDDQGAIRALATVRHLIVEYRKRVDSDWRADHARTDYIVNVVAGLIADAEAIDKLHKQTELRIQPLREQIESLKEQLAEAKRPFTAQMQMQNNRIIALTAELDRLKGRIA